MSWLIGKDSDAGRDWGQEEKGTAEDEMAGWHHGLDGRESEWTPADGDGQGGLACCHSWGRKESDMTERLNWTELNTKCTNNNEYVDKFNYFITYMQRKPPNIEKFQVFRKIFVKKRLVLWHGELIKNLSKTQREKNVNRKKWMKTNMQRRKQFTEEETWMTNKYIMKLLISLY